MKKRNGRSALNSFGSGFLEIDNDLVTMITAVAAAASEPNTN